MNPNDIEDFRQMLRQQSAQLEREKEEIIDRSQQLQALQNLLSEAQSNEKKLASMQEKLERLQAENDDLRAENKALASQAAEMQKMSVHVMKNTQQDNIITMLRSYMSLQKRKSANKRSNIKIVITELLTMAKIQVPEDMRCQLDAFDDEHDTIKPEGHVVISQAHINTIYSN